MNGTYTQNGARLAYWETGSGLPVIFLHPTPLDGEYWRPMIGQMRGIRAIVPDLRGHGISELGHGLPMGAFKPVPDAPVLTMEQLGSDILALVDHLSLKTAVFAGCSIGGYALLELWRRAPQRVRGAAFVCSNPSPILKRIWSSGRQPSKKLAPATRKHSSTPSRSHPLAQLHGAPIMASCTNCGPA